MMISRLVMSALFGAALVISPVSKAFAQGADKDLERAATSCPDLGIPSVKVVSYSGLTMQSQEKTAFDIAREKSVRYHAKMPMRQGSNGKAIFRVVTDIELVPYPSLGCIFVKNIDVSVNVDHKVEIASEHAAGTCVYNELFNLETELMQQDETLVNNEMRAIQAVMKKHFKDHSVYGPISGIDINEATAQKEQEIRNMVDKMISLVDEKAEKARREADQTQFYDDIVAECSGGSAN